MKLSQPLPPMPAILGDSTCAVLPNDSYGTKNTIPLMHRDHLVGNREFVTFFVFYTESVMLVPRCIPESVFYTESVMLGPRFIPESVFYTQSVMLSPHFIPESVFYTQSVVRSPQSVFYTDHIDSLNCDLIFIQDFAMEISCTFLHKDFLLIFDGIFFNK